VTPSLHSSRLKSPTSVRYRTSLIPLHLVTLITSNEAPHHAIFSILLLLRGASILLNGRMVDEGQSGKDLEGSGICLDGLSTTTKALAEYACRALWPHKPAESTLSTLGVPESF
jgi:hypothetical protein